MHIVVREPSRASKFLVKSSHRILPSSPEPSTFTWLPRSSPFLFSALHFVFRNKSGEKNNNNNNKQTRNDFCGFLRRNEIKCAQGPLGGSVGKASTSARVMISLGGFEPTLGSALSMQSSPGILCLPLCLCPYPPPPPAHGLSLKNKLKKIKLPSLPFLTGNVIFFTPWRLLLAAVSRAPPSGTARLAEPVAPVKLSLFFAYHPNLQAVTAPSPGRELSRTAPHTPAGLGRPSELPVLRACPSSRGELSEAVAAPSGDTSAGGAMPWGSPSGVFSSLPSPPREHARAKGPGLRLSWPAGSGDEPVPSGWTEGGRP
ncbi:uncharacterized protein LOC123384041 isoform X3 [Felis catus]|nr:uncharacterized protein LOC123384041 isoform X3 [Felis catus]XP_044908722.1 uncharacterized protein LOC123384041 isoform X3 [Felis catus]XP_044908723.1 uncharacterized protein LOC123384041 isoform X3 [Felis catus]XP_044908724.1 uncharacterized protein LOC123384041 isoform X3 [Felis catus]